MARLKMQNFIEYVDRYGNKRLAYKLLDGSFYTFGDNNSFQQGIFVLNNSEFEPRFKDEKGTLTIEEMLMSQLKGKGEYIYYWDPFEGKISIGNKSDIEKLVRFDRTLNKVYSGLEIKK